ncbi:MAG TPA: ATP-binding protein, partial [Planctomycetota bacterium]|nr:ATP-binding protein [Planctomycetota bacterium]
LAILSLEGDVIRCNRAFQRIAGRSSEEIVGMPLSQSIPELAPHLASAHVDAVEVAVDGSWLRLTLEPLEDDQGRIAGTMCVLNDVTESRRSRDRLEARVEARAAELAEVNRELRAALDQHRKSELDLRERTRALEASNAELERFAYVSSHDLQEPLRMVVAYSQLLAERYKGRLDADADEYIHFAVEGALRMQTLIRDLLAYSRVGANERIRTVDLEEVARRAVANLQAAIDESHATIEIAPLPNVMGDDAQLSQLFQNVLSNAIKFRREAPPAIRICAADSNDPKRVRIGIADNGIGIEMPYRERIFEIFQRLHTREEFPGTGVGLAIAKKTVERHGGRIWVESEPGCGSTFFFTLPRAVERSGERAERTNGRSASDAV